jgi:outer membrane receptor for ferrienterochelin and colicins
MPHLHPQYLFLGLLICAFSQAENATPTDPLDEAFHLETHKVIGSNSSMGHLSQVPVRVEFISKSQLEANHAINLTDALKYSAGVQLRPITGKSGEGVWLQGYESDRVAILMDGTPLAAGTGSSVDISQIAIGDVERIEISKGAMSAIYGSSAMGGVVNVITQAPELGQHVKLTYSGGSWGSQDETTSTNPFAKQHLKAGYSVRNEKGYAQILLDNQISEGFRSDNAIGTQGWNGYKSNLSAKTFYQFDDSSTLTISPRLYREDIKTTNDNFIGGIGNVPKDKVDITSKNYLSATFEKDNQKQGKLKISYSIEGYENVSQQDLVQTTHIEQARTTDITHSGFIAQYQINDNYFNQYIFGIELLQDEMHATSVKNDGIGNIETAIEVDNKTTKNYNNFMQISQQATSELEWLVSGRINNNDKYGMKFSPMLNFQYLPTNWLPGDLSFRLGTGHGYRTPTLKELYHFFDHTHIGYALVGNENLLPESSINYQATMEWQPNSDTSFDVSVYYNKIKNLIDFIEDQSLTTELSDLYGSPDQPIITGNIYTNINNAVTSGFELSVSRKFNHIIASQFSYAYLKSENTDTGKSLTNRPEHDVKIGVDLNTSDNTQTSIKYRYSSEQFSDADNTNITPAFSQVDLKINYKWSQNISLFAGIDNITGTQKKMFDGNDLRPEEGRYIYLGIKL